MFSRPCMPTNIILALVLLFGALVFGASSAFSAPTLCTMQSLNGRLLPSEHGEEEAFSFILVGHAYGAPESGRSVYPSASFCASIPLFVNGSPAFIALLGDAYWSGGRAIYADNLVRVLEQVPFPVYNAPGNHEGDRELYNARFGSTYGKVRFGNALLIFLDTDLTAGEIQGEQLAFFIQEMETAERDDQIKAIFVLSHRLIWAPAMDWTDIVFQHLNSQSGYSSRDRFQASIHPILTALAERKQVYWISGNVGVSWSLPLFWERDPASNVTFGACGLGDTERDAAILITVDKQGKATPSALSLTGQQLLPLESYNTEYWRAYFAGELIQEDEPETPTVSWYVTVAHKAALVIRTKTFYAGIIVGLSIAALIWFALRMRRSLHR